MKQIAFSRDALKTLSRIPTNTAKLIRSKIEQYARNPSSLANNVIKLEDRPGYRLRVGDWRIIFGESATTIEVIKIGPRGGVYE